MKLLHIPLATIGVQVEQVKPLIVGSSGNTGTRWL